MKSENHNHQRCFLCRKKILNSTAHKIISETTCSSSKKNTKVVLNHLANVSNLEIHIAKADLLCLDCYMHLEDYDTSLMRLLTKQKKLADMIEKSLLGFEEIEEIYEAELQNLEEFIDEPLIDDVEVSDNEILETINEAFGRKCKKKSTNVEKKPLVKASLESADLLLECAFCAMRFRSKIRLHKHLERAHRKFSCDLCDYSHRNEDYVKLHMNLHEGKKETQCRFCDKVFSTKISTMRHMEAHMDIKKYQCDKCGLCFSQTTIMYNHKLQHEAEEQPLQCDLCSQVFKTKRTYRHHMITHRADRPRHACEYCGKTFTEKYTLKVHKRTHHESTQAPDQVVVTNGLSTHEVTLEEISDHFVYEVELDRPKEKQHDVIVKTLSVNNYNEFEIISVEERKSCEICGQIFDTQSNLDMHKFHMHGYGAKTSV